MNASSGAEAPFRPSSSSRSGLWPTVLLAWAALAVPLVLVVAVVCALIPGLAWWIGVVLGAVAAVALVVLRLRGASTLLLAALAARPAKKIEHARFFNIVQGLSLAEGVAEPELCVVIDQARNVAVVAQGGQATVVATTGLLEALDRIALEGILAEALVRIGNGDAEASTIGASLFGPLLSGPLAVLTRPMAGFGLRRLLGSDRDLAADRAAVALTRYPPGLLSALDLVRAGSAVVAQSTPATDHVWLIPRAAIDGGDDVVISTASLDLRIDVLGEF